MAATLRRQTPPPALPLHVPSDVSMPGRRGQGCLSRVCGLRFRDARGGLPASEHSIASFTTTASGTSTGTRWARSSSERRWPWERLPDEPPAPPPLGPGTFAPPSAEAGPAGQPAQTTQLTRLLAAGDFVQVWSNSRARWFEDGVVEEVMHTGGVVNGIKVPPGSIRVRFGGESKKLLDSTQADAEVRRSPCRWVPVKEGGPLPSRCVQASSARGSEAFVARVGGELARLAPAEKPGPREAAGARLQSTGSCEVLALGACFAARWVPVKKLQPLPAGAVWVSLASKEAPGAFVGRDESGELCAVVPNAEAGTVDRISPPAGAGLDLAQCEVLVVCEARGELEVELVRLEALSNPEYRSGEVVQRLAGKTFRALKPYVELEFQGSVWRSGWREASGGNAELHECAHLPLLSVQGETPQLAVSVLDARRGSPLARLPGGGGGVSDASVGGCRAAPWEGAEGEEQTVELLRNSSHGRLVLRVRRRIAGASLGLHALVAAAEPWGALRDRLRARAADLEPELPGTLLVCLDALEALATGPSGNATLVVLGAGCAAGPPFEYVDEGLLMELARKAVGSVCEQEHKFRALLAASTARGPDRWEAQQLVELSNTLEAPQELAKALTGKARGGAWVLSSRGTVRAVGAQLVTDSSAFEESSATGAARAAAELVLPGGILAGSRLREAAAAAQWVAGAGGPGGAVLVRTEDGAVCALLPTLDGDRVHAHYVPAARRPGGAAAALAHAAR